jgi:hypothetical protein
MSFAEMPTACIVLAVLSVNEYGLIFFEESFLTP